MTGSSGADPGAPSGGAMSSGGAIRIELRVQRCEHS